MARNHSSTEKGFTLIELLVVIAIIGLLASIVLAALSTARAKARDSERLSDLKQLQTALEEYATSNNGNYPTNVDSGAGTWSGICSTWNNNCTTAFGTNTSCTNSGPSGYIPNLAPTYISVLPTDPIGVSEPYGGPPNPYPWNSSSNCYIYSSNGKDYKIEAWFSDETYPQVSNPLPNPAALTNPTFSVYTSGAASW